MSIIKIKELAKEIGSTKIISVLKTSGTFGSNNPFKKLRELLELIDSYEAPKPKVIESPTTEKPKTRRTRRTTKKEDSVE